MSDASIGTPEQLRDPNYTPPIAQAVPLGIQHVLAMFVSNVTPAIIVAGAAGFGFGSNSPDFPELLYMIQMSMLFAGLCTLLQTITVGPVGAALPIVQGTSFAFVPIMIPLVAGKGVDGLAAMYGGIVVGGLFHAALGSVIGKIRFALPPLVTGLVVTMIGLALGAIVAYVAEIHRYKHPGGAAERVALSIFTMTYIGLMMSFIASLRLIEFADAPGEDWGIVALLSLMFVVKVSDIGAYASGRTFGRNKMTPNLSPGKTWEGFVGGIVLAALASCFFFWLIAPRFVPDPVNSLRAAAYGAVLAICGVGGDLAVSLLKRDSGRKDSSNWLLGLGGILDILDSVLLAAPIAYLAWKFGLVGPG